MAQVKLIKTEQPQQFKPVTIQITFETQEEVNAMRSVFGCYSTAWVAAEKEKCFYGKSKFSDFKNTALKLYLLLKPLCK